MKRKMMTHEKVPSKKNTNGGNGSYMRRKMVQDVERGRNPLSAQLQSDGTLLNAVVAKGKR